ncbi:hypothetical protein LMG28688_06932 [Paraburkholderia caffeinitolerans]|uniref:Uncharacterized protein n=2 Tax=Paraburkholderia caffeinitolerans TaxID=1723730 RepID=A0A6J5GZU0_9BURK|nr:hypothetical protein LMG28688_06932 [Paraburkholderia caffeinitolerans]
MFATQLDPIYALFIELVSNSGNGGGNADMLGANGAQFASKTVWKGDGKERIDVENPNPGQRPGQIHYQDNQGKKYLYDPSTNSFPDAPNSVNKLLNDPNFNAAIQKKAQQVPRWKLMKINGPMRNLLRSTQASRVLAPSLSEIVRDGFEVRDGCSVLRALSKHANVPRARFTDCTGYECFVNSLHVEDYIAEMPFEQALLFVGEILNQWRLEQPVSCLVAILVADELSVVAKFHVKRHGEQWLGDDIERYEDPTMSLDSNDDIATLLKDKKRIKSK